MAYSVILMTAATEEEAGRLARMLVERRLAACVSQVPGLHSVYWWEGAVQESQEVLLIAKTLKTKVKELVKAVKREHSASVPEVLSLPVKEGSRDYLRWIAESLKGEG
jgi:periplasmic divalent cation tolerance protein